MMNCCLSCVSKVNPCQPWFSVLEQNDRIIDVENTFSPQSCRVLFWKTVATVYCCGAAIARMINQAGRTEYYFVYFSNVCVLFCCFYMALSLSNSLYPVKANDVLDKLGTNITSVRLCATWVAYELATAMGIAASIIFYSMVKKKHLTYIMMETHGVVVSVALIDGLIVNRIPVRLHHWLGAVVPVELLYGGWTVIYSFLDIENPDLMDDDNVKNAEVIYELLDWKDDWKTAALFSFLNIFGLDLIIYLILWILSSRLFKPKYLSEAENSPERKHDLELQ